MATDLCEGAFQPNFAKKTTKVVAPVKVSGYVKAMKLLGQIFRLMYVS